jgi:hypothetical protein
LTVGALVDATDRFGNTALHFAVLGSRMLLARGATVDRANTRNTRAFTPLADSIDFNLCASGCLLMDHGAQLSKVSKTLCVPAWPVSFAAGRERARVVALLVVGVRSMKRSPVLAGNPMDIARIIAQWVWSTRGWDNNKSGLY